MRPARGESTAARSRSKHFFLVDNTTSSGRSQQPRVSMRALSQSYVPTWGFVSVLNGWNPLLINIVYTTLNERHIIAHGINVYYVNDAGTGHQEFRREQDVRGHHFRHNLSSMELSLSCVRRTQ